MNDDKWKRTVAKRRRQRKVQNLLAILASTVVLLLFSSIAGYCYYRHIHSPEYTLEEIQAAFEQRDIDTLHKYIDFESVLTPNYQILTDDIFNNDKFYGQKEHTIYQNFYKMIASTLIEGTIDCIDKYIQTGNWQRFNNDSMLKGRQLGIDYTELANRSLLFNTNFKSVKNLNYIDDVNAIATILVADKYTNTDFDLQIHLKKSDDNIWRVDDIPNYKDYLTATSTLYRKDIDTYIKNTKEDLNKTNAKFRELQTEFTILAEQFKTSPTTAQRALLKSFIDNKIIPAYQDWYNYLQASNIPTGARHLHELRIESTTDSIQAWKAYAIGISDNKPADLAKAERLHQKAMETEQKVTDTINNMPALFMSSID